MILKNKQGIAPLVWFAIIGIPTLILLFSGGISAWKLNSTISSIPTWFWYVLIFVMFILIIGKKKK